MLYKDKTESILNAFYKVYNKLGYGFLEKVYENALMIELQKKGHIVKCQYPINVFYDEQKVGEYYSDLIVDDCVIIENKATEVLREEHEYQLLNYLKATNIEVGLLLNFGKKPSFKRKFYTNDRK